MSRIVYTVFNDGVVYADKVWVVTRGDGHDIDISHSYRTENGIFAEWIHVPTGNIPTESLDEKTVLMNHLKAQYTR